MRGLNGTIKNDIEIGVEVSLMHLLRGSSIPMATPYRRNSLEGAAPPAPSQGGEMEAR